MKKVLSVLEDLRQQEQPSIRRMRGLLLLVVIGFLVFVGSLTWAFDNPIARAFNDLSGSQEEIIYDRPITAQHEHSVTAYNPASIPFLPKDGPQPKIFVEKKFYAFGKVGPKEIVSHDFVIVNRGEAPLTISRAYTTCGCTTAEISASVIPPGKAARVTVNFDAGFHDVRGQTVRRGVIIESNDPSGWQSEIWIQAAVASR